ncbi:MAG: polymer-forming cytoskeletal protein [Elusimicrobiota bacterium]|jgi:cytoskeletal protein CcmA (bactofilin family)|nr:polymer-forming cytoskeletal protein [Elusimicrobiota bacterium]
MSKKSSKSLLEAVETIIGGSAVFEGEIKTDKVVRVDGKFVGNIEAAGVMIGAEGQIIGNINTIVIMIGGYVKGNISAKESIEMLPKSRVEGDITTDLLTIVEGAYFEGKSSKIKTDEEYINTINSEE